MTKRSSDNTLQGWAEIIMTSKEVEPALDPTWRSDKAREAIRGAADRIANCYCSEDDTFEIERERLVIAISQLVDQCNSADSAGAMVDGLLPRLISELERAIEQGYQPNLLDVVEATRLLSATEGSAENAAREILDYLNFDCDNEEVKQDISNAAYIITKHCGPAVPRDEAAQTGNNADLAQSVRIGIYNWTLGLADDRLAVITNKDVQALADMVIAAITNQDDTTPIKAVTIS